MLKEVTKCLDDDDFMAEAMQRVLSCHSSVLVSRELWSILTAIKILTVCA